MTVDSEPRRADAERARAIREAEDFVRAQGYTDAPPSVSGDAVVREGIEAGLPIAAGCSSPARSVPTRAAVNGW